MGADELRLDGPQPRLQGLVPRHARRERRLLRAVRRTTRGAGTGSRRRRSCTGTTRSCNPPVDRNRPPDEVADVFVHVEKETDAGLVVSGAKVVATGSALTHYNFIAHYGLPIKKREFALVATVPMDAPGMKLICRAVLHGGGRGDGQPVRLPAVLPARRERHDPDPGQGPHPVGERVRLRRHRQGPVVHRRVRVPRSGSRSTAAPGSRSSSTSSPACCRRRWRSPAPRTSAACRPGSARCSPGATCSGALSDAAARNPDAVAERRGAAQPGSTAMAYRWFMQIGYPRVREIVLQDVASGADLPELQRRRLQEPGDPPLPRQVRARLERHRRRGRG